MRSNAPTPTTRSPSGEQPVNWQPDTPVDHAEDRPDRVNGSSIIIIRVGALCAVLGAVSLVTQQIWSIVAGEVIEIDTPILGRILYAAQIALFVFAVVGLYLHQRKAFNTFGQIATLTALSGTLLWSGSTTWEALDVLRNGGKLVEDDMTAPVLVWILIAFGLYALGLFLFGVATWRAGVLPRIPAALVVFGILLGLLLDGLLPGILIVYGAGLAWLGIATLVQLRSRQPAGAHRPPAPVH